MKALIDHFDDLNRAHEAVLKAKRQMEMLGPLVADCDRHAELLAATEQLRRCRDALKPYFAELKLDLLEKRAASLTDDVARQNAQVARLEELKRSQKEEEREHRRTIAENGGDRIERIGEEIRRNEDERGRRLEKAQRYAELTRGLDLLPAEEDEAFLVQRGELQSMRETALQHEADVQNEHNEALVEFAQGRRENDELNAEIASLRARRSNIDARQIEIRATLCSKLGLPQEDVPFAGELLQVREEHGDWEGTIERVLRTFGLSLLVRDDEYARVAEWVDRTHLKGRLVYFRVREGRRIDPIELHPDSLARKIAIKPRLGVLRLAGARDWPALQFCLLLDSGAIPP